MWPLVDHFYSITTTTKKKTFDVVILPMASKKITTSKIKNIFFKQLPMAYYLWIPRPVGPWGFG
jgi:hypothetical protein